MNKILIEDVMVEDAKEILDIYRPYIEKTAITFEYDVPKLEEFTQRIVNIKKKYPYIKAVDENGKILGYAYASTFKARRAYDWSVETSIYVDMNLKGKGLGRKLYEALEEKLKKQGIANMYACIAYTETEDEYLTNDSERFHEKLGFVRNGTFHKCAYKFNRWYDMIWMEKFIKEHK